MSSPDQAQRATIVTTQLHVSPPRPDQDQLAARDHESDHAHAVLLARRLIGRPGSYWHDVDQVLARAVLRLELQHEK